MSAEQNVVDAPIEQRAGHSAGEESGEHGGSFETDENGQRVPHGMGQSKSSRRRRRKRKGKGAEAGGAEGSDQGGSEGEPGSGSGGEASGVIQSVQASAAPAQQQPRSSGGGYQGRNGGGGFQQNGGGQSQGGAQNNGAAPGGTKRWKKKFRDRNGRQNDNPGNQPAGGGGFQQNGGSGSFAAASSPAPNQGGGFRDRDTHQPGNGGGGGFKRKGGFGGGGGGGKQQSRGPRSFVGPMDHSYRAVNGNFAETPPSTIEPHGSYGGNQPRRGGYQGDSQPIDYSQGRTVPIAADAPTHIYFFIEDLFFIAKIQETARKLGVKVAFVKNDKDSLATLTTGHEEDERQILVVFDLNNANAKPLTLIPKLKTKMKKSISIIGFLSHLQGDLKAKAVEAGCNTVMPRAAFSQNLPNLLRRYGLEDAEEANYNQ